MGVIWDASEKPTAPTGGVVWDETPPPTGSDVVRSGGSPPFSGLTGSPPDGSQENWLVKNYRDYVAEPLTNAVSFMGEYDPMEAAQKWSGQPVTNQWPHLAAPGSPQAKTESEGFARAAVPQTPVGGATALASAAVAPFGLLANILGPAAAAGVTSLLSGNTEKEAGIDAAVGGTVGGVGKGLMQGGSALLQRLPWMKGLINESHAQGLQGVVGGINRDAANVVNDQVVSPTLRGGTTAAKLRQAATGGDLQKVASGQMETAMQQVDSLAGNPTLAGDALNRAYDLIPQVVKDEVVGPIGLNGYTLRQAQMIRAYIGGKAFSRTAADQGIDDAALISLRNKMTGEIESVLPPEARALWQQANRAYGGVSVIDEFLNERAATQGLPNRMFLNRNTLSDFLDVNRQDLIRRMGREQYDQVVQAALSGAQPGTRDILTPGAGTPLSAFMQTFGRGTNTGSINAVGVPLRTGLPGLGSEYTGRGAFSVAPEFQSLFNYLSQTNAPEAAAPYTGRPVKLGPIPGR